MLRRIQIICMTALVVLGVGPVVASAQSRLLQALDENKDGKINRDEIPEGPRRKMFDNMIRRYKLDAQKTYTIPELEQATGLSRGGTSGSSSSSGPAADLRKELGRSGFSLGKPGRPTFDGRRFRPLTELPEQYRSYDKNGDGQVGLYEWPRDRIPEFLSLDTNDDGFLTINELRRPPTLNGEKKPGEEKKGEKKPEPQPPPDDDMY